MAREFSKSFYNSKEWKSCREYVLMRDKYLCIKCGRPAEEVHHFVHLNQENITDLKITLNPENLASLCKDCHFAEHRQDKADGHRKKGSYSLPVYEFDEFGRPVTPPIKL